ISPAREVTKARGQFVFAIDGQPALQVLKRDIGEVLARDLRRAEGYIFAGLLNGRPDTPYAVRRIVATDEKSGAVVLSEAVKAGQHILFARRDKEGALDELRRMLHQMEAKLGGRVPQGAIYVACHQRVAALFGSADTELQEIRRVFGDVPLTGFLSDGEFYDSRCYGYTGVLTLFY
ncbi:MAG: FIST C-terminal domain-containing protein, partial [Pseudomonadota bacterium]